MSWQICILDGNSDICVHVRINLGYLICARHFIRSRTVTNRIFLNRKVLSSFVHAQYVLSYHIYYKYPGIHVSMYCNPRSIRLPNIYDDICFYCVGTKKIKILIILSNECKKMIKAFFKRFSFYAIFMLKPNRNL